MSPSLEAVESIYINAQINLADMLAACPTQTERDQVMTEYVCTRQNYYACINKTFHDDDPTLANLVTQAKASAKEIENIEKQLGDITKVIATLATAVKYGSEIVGKIITL